jgi:hypothetical protein
MSQTTTLILLPQTTYNANTDNCATSYTVVGDKQPAASYYLGNKCLQTVTYLFENVTGNLVIDATLATSPSEKDWFKVFELAANSIANTNSNVSSYTNINGNFVYMRAKIVNFSTGIVSYVKVSY